MSAWLWAIIVIAIAIVAVLILATAIRSRRSQQLKEGFGPEYDRTGDRHRAEAELRERQMRHDELELRPLAPLARKGFMDAWQGTQAEFV
ncbi:MAG: hypothetical protein QOD37_1366, partial [Gaiellales bacterium]|nr:hypothetical protein [Gaiellales bacterium]